MHKCNSEYLIQSINEENNQNLQPPKLNKDLL